MKKKTANNTIDILRYLHKINYFRDATVLFVLLQYDKCIGIYYFTISILEVLTGSAAAILKLCFK